MLMAISHVNDLKFNSSNAYLTALWLQLDESCFQLWFLGINQLHIFDDVSMCYVVQTQAEKHHILYQSKSQYMEYIYHIINQ